MAAMLAQFSSSTHTDQPSAQPSSAGPQSIAASTGNNGAVTDGSNRAVSTERSEDAAITDNAAASPDSHHDTASMPSSSVAGLPAHLSMLKFSGENP